ncbi:TetR/AcrR family transcriptional regulator [Tenggerimyces flavus]|uniref:TetR/AcrR family transcriptional regulator n=1 Tax=Tenggerimyces flavus TaxID=1708749 RepID=A0ABV7YP91_9ACTN|nr:TetR/AcrR family transcriptional regulator [Tenggerimyces flavus]MBM7786459.1 AcrR family transcriptional regulator [Tenggerimyces flavus]
MPERSPDPARRSERSRTAILSATRKLSAELGYQAMSIEAIAAAAGVGKQTIYRWWPSKGVLMLDMWGEQVQLQGEFPDTGDVAADLKVQIRGLVELANDPELGPSLRSLIGAAQHEPALLEELLTSIVRPRIEACKRRLRKAQEDGQINRGVDLDIAVDLLYGGFYHRLVLPVTRLDDAFVNGIVDEALRGIGATL